MVLGSAAYRRVTERAAFFVNNVNWPGTVAKRDGSVHIHTHQGTPLKYMGVDLLGRPGARHGLDVPQMLRRADRWDHSLVASRYAERIWERAYPCHFASARTGSPRNDVLVDAGPEDGRRVRERLGLPQDHTVVLYAPTRREYRRGGLVERLDVARLAADLGEGHTLVVRLHPSLATGPARGLGLAELHRRGVVVDATDEPHVEDLMLASDLLITDYSALMFDYALLDRPILIHADDWGPYRATRGTYFDITEEAPGHVSRSYRELAWLLASGAWRARRRRGCGRPSGPGTASTRTAGPPSGWCGRCCSVSRCPRRAVRRPRPRRTAGRDLLPLPRPWAPVLALGAMTLLWAPSGRGGAAISG
ncbi:hypothetical protein STENM36S_00234 [Streptomyces tendae]